MKNWTDWEIIEEMNFIDSEGYTKGLSIRWHSPRWYALESILRERHGENWGEILSATA